MGRDPDGYEKHIRVCSMHFPPDAYNASVALRERMGLPTRVPRLRPNVVPTLYLPTDLSGPPKRPRLVSPASAPFCVVREPLHIITAVGSSQAQDSYSVGAVGDTNVSLPDGSKFYTAVSCRSASTQTSPLRICAATQMESTLSQRSMHTQVNFYVTGREARGTQTGQLPPVKAARKTRVSGKPPAPGLLLGCSSPASA